MPIYDHRVFRHDGEWWVAQVHARNGADLALTRETVYFTSVTDRRKATVVATIDGEGLNRLSHQGIVELLKVGQPWTARMDAQPYNHPDPRSYSGAEVILDDEQLRWVASEVTIPKLTKQRAAREQTAIRLVCLDDTALQAVVPVDGPEVEVREIMSQRMAGMQEIIRAVKERYRPLLHVAANQEG